MGISRVSNHSTMIQENSTMGKLSGKRVAVLVEKGFEQVELTSPVEKLREEGADVKIISPQQGTVKGWNHTEWGDDFNVDLSIDDASPEEFDALVLPGGVMN